MPTSPSALDPRGKIDYGKDYNFFRSVTPGSSGAAVFATEADVVINMQAPTYTVTFWAPSGTSVQYSFNGYTVHGTLDGAGTTAPNFLTFENRVISKIWFTYLGGGGTVRVEAWAIR